jgi:Tol biopolymer transport system component
VSALREVAGLKRTLAGMNATLGSVAALLLLASVAVKASDVGRGATFTKPIRNGKVAFSDTGPSSPFGLAADLFLIEPDGSNRQRLTECTTRNCIVRAFAWSPDGRRLAFTRGSMGGPRSRADLSLYVIEADGHGERRLDGCGRPRWPSCGDFFGSQIAWSPDGSRLVVPRERSLYVFNVDRNRFRRLTNCGLRTCFDIHPAWAPSGGRIVFARLAGPYAESLYSVKADGSGLKRLTKPRPSAQNPVWSPDGRRIAFDAVDNLNIRTARLFVMKADGSRMRVLRSGPADTGPGVPAWSPDARRIVFLTTPGTPGSYRAAVWVINRTGSGRRLLYRSPCCIDTWGRPIWSPDGSYVAFGVGVRSDPDSSGIFVIKADGRGLRRLATAPTEAAWQRVR